MALTPTLEAALSAMDASPGTDPYAHARARALLNAYDLQWADKWKNYDVINVEVEFTFPLLNPETGGESRSFVEAGKIDVEAINRTNKSRVVIEHKTTTDSVDPDSDYWDRLRMDPQVSKYFLALAAKYAEPVEVVYDVIRKPGQRMTQIPKLDPQGVKIVLDRDGNRVKTKDGKKWRESADAAQGFELQTRDETPQEHEVRVLETILKDPNSYFGHRSVTRRDQDIIEFMGDEWSLSQQILYFRGRNLWPRNPQACSAYGKCEMFDLCAGRTSIDGINYRQKPNVHAELKMQNAGDRQLLTNSRATTLRKCSRLHQLRYEDQIERVGSEEAEALAFGSLVHLGLEAYFNTLKKLQNVC